MNRRFLASALLGAAMAGTSALTGALTPTVKVAQAQAPFRLETMIPQRFGAWRVDPSVVPLTPDPEQQGLLRKLYDQTLSRTSWKQRAIDSLPSPPTSQVARLSGSPGSVGSR